MDVNFPAALYHLEGEHCLSPINAGFLIEVDHLACTVLITLRIALDLRAGDPITAGERYILCGPQEPASPEHPGCEVPWDELIAYRREKFERQKRRWRRGIRRAWSDRYDLVQTSHSGVSGCRVYRIRVDVEWVDPEILDPDAREGGDPRVDHVVTVVSHVDREDTNIWGLDSNGPVAAHEVGHYLGNIDEYDGTCDGCPDRPILDGSIMNDAEADPTGVFAHHFWLVRWWMVTRTCTSFDVVPRVAGLQAPPVVRWTDVKSFFNDIVC